MENKYQLSRIHNYVNGLMSRDEMYVLEREALDDPFLQDAIDGYKLQEGVDAKQLSLLQQRLTTRIAEQSIGKNRRFYSWQRLAIGATAAVMFVAVCTLFLLRYFPQPKSNLAEVEVMQDQVFSITVGNTGQFDGEPMIGWSKYELYLSHDYRGVSHREGEVLVRFKIDEKGRPYQLSIDGNKDLKPYAELVDLLENGPKWRGGEVEIRIDLHRLKM
ncbi:hypothetical protein [Sphingobacterium faecale]|uniref:Anti-sigma factor n=1 Tax=Sphingobacterium faecale TaxID=2803775 RepID=A0ABS1R7G6_9SPHI|nr:hypothetical protein [Sphingobacterium faecale]MBL1410642.1 hypothetical protein [Sphingobacterium faecale]